MTKTAKMAALLVAALTLALPVSLHAAEAEKEPAKEELESKDSEKPAAEVSKDRLVPLKIKLPKPMFKGTPKNTRYGTRVEKARSKPRPPAKVPEGTVNISLEKKVASSDKEPIIGEAELATDGDKEGTEGSFVELGPGLQWVQIDLGAEFEIQVIIFWHYHGEARVYHDVVVQTASDADFIEDVKSLYNNDHDNSAGLGIGKDLEYIETYEGRLVQAKGHRARYVRLYSQGNTTDEMNHYTEVEIYGKPVK